MSYSEKHNQLHQNHTLAPLLINKGLEVLPNMHGLLFSNNDWGVSEPYICDQRENIAKFGDTLRIQENRAAGILHFIDFEKAFKSLKWIGVSQ